MIEIRSLEETSFDDLYTAFAEAFKDYDRTWTREEFAKMLQRRAYRPEISFGAFDGDKLVSFTLNAQERFYNKLSAYDTATGTIKEYQGQGLATRIFNALLPGLKQAGVEQYLLEVLQHNTKAVSVYEKIGFKVHREFNYFLAKRNTINIAPKAVAGLRIRSIPLNDRERMTAMWDFEPSWQNSFAAIDRCIEDFIVLGAFIDEHLVGYGVVEPSSGDISQVAVDRNYRRKGIGCTLLKELSGYIRHENIKILNSEKSDAGFTHFAEANGIPYLGSQYEMVLNISN